MQCIFKAKNFILIQPDTRDLHLRSADETLVHVVVALLRILGIDIYIIILLRFPVVARIRVGSYRSLRSIGVRDGGQGGQLPPPKKITKSKCRANVQHKSGEEWEIKKPKMPKSPQFVGQTKAVGQYSLHSRAILAYYKKNWDKLCQFCG